MANPLVLAIDEGTSGCRTIAVDASGAIVARAQRDFAQHYPQPGWVEHDAMEIWEAQLETLREVVSLCRGREIAAIGVTNQRETVVVWDRVTGHPVANAIVWQDRRTTDAMIQMRRDGVEQEIGERTGLTLDPYFSASKAGWILDHVPGVRQRAERGELALGTIDSWLVWKLTSGRIHATDVSNASRTMLANLSTLDWDPWLLERFGIPPGLLPTIGDSSGVIAEADASMIGHTVPIAGVAGDQQCALFGQGCLELGATKTTFGTGCFLLRNAGANPPHSASRLLRTAAWRRRGTKAVYAVEGSVFMGGAAIQWLRDGLGIIKSAAEVNTLAMSVADSGGVVVVPAMTGLGAPHWDPSARGAIMGLTRGSTAAHIARATLEGIAMQVVDVVDAMGGLSGETMRVDGGACASDLLMQIVADLLGAPIERPALLETTALGAAYLAGLGVGLWKSEQELGALRKVDRTFVPQMDPSKRTAMRARWSRAVDRTRHWEDQR
ncbi:MAG: glycerol kinase [Phycisphaerales bacterium]|nr:glycerol kinase [Phycisphaerales bacterium]